MSKIIITSTSVGMAIGGLSGGYIGWRIHNRKKNARAALDTVSSIDSKKSSQKSVDSSSTKAPPATYDNRSFVDISSKTSLKPSGDLLPLNLKQLRNKTNYELFDDLMFLYKFSLHDNAAFVGICNKVDSLLDLSEYVHDRKMKVTPLQLRKASTYFSNVKKLCDKFVQKIASSTEKVQVQEHVKSIIEKCENHFQNTISEVTMRM